MSRVALRQIRGEKGAAVKHLPSVARGVLRRWLALANAATGLFLCLPFLAPVLLRQGRPELANMIYSAYHVTCHEWPFRAYFLFGPQATYSMAELEARGVNAVFDFRGSAELGYKVAFCERNVAIYAAALLAGLLYARLGRRLPTLSFSGYLLLLAPMAFDGFSQLGGWRESTWELRTLTGVLFGAGSIWLLYPRLDQLVSEVLAPRPIRHPIQSAAA